jgi:hypothetical protein
VGIGEVDEGNLGSWKLRVDVPKRVWLEESRVHWRAAGGLGVLYYQLWKG